MHVFGNTWGRVNSNGGPNSLDVSFGDCVGSQKVACGIRTIHFEPKLALPGALRKAEVVKHSCGVKQLRIKNQTLPLPGQRTPKVDPIGVIKHQVARGVAKELLYVACHFTVRDLYARNVARVYVSFSD